MCPPRWLHCQTSKSKGRVDKHNNESAINKQPQSMTSGKGHLALAVFRCFSCPRASCGILGCLGMSQDALGQLKHLKTARARWPFPDGCGGMWNRVVGAAVKRTAGMWTTRAGDPLSAGFLFSISPHTPSSRPRYYSSKTKHIVDPWMLLLLTPPIAFLELVDLLPNGLHHLEASAPTHFTESESNSIAEATQSLIKSKIFSNIAVAQNTLHKAWRLFGAQQVGDRHRALGGFCQIFNYQSGGERPLFVRGKEYRSEGWSQWRPSPCGALHKSHFGITVAETHQVLHCVPCLYSIFIRTTQCIYMQTNHCTNAMSFFFWFSVFLSWNPSMWLCILQNEARSKWSLK